MKKMRDWVRQEDLDAKLDEFVEDTGQVPAGMTPNEVAEKLGVTANGKFYRQFRDWKHRRDAEAAMPPLDIPDEVRTELENVLSEANEQVMEQFARVVRGIAGDIDRSAALRVRDAERRAAEAKADAEHILERWTETEKDFEAARDWAATVQKEADELRREADRLRGQYEERGKLLAQLQGQASQPAVSRADTNSAAMAVSPDVDGLGGPKPAAPNLRKEGDPSIPEPIKGGPERPVQSSTTKGDGKNVHHTELSLGNTDDAVQAEAGDDEND